MSKCTRFFSAVIIVMLTASAAHAIPQLINYQGILTDGGGTPITIATNVQFRIWNAAAGGDELWMETQSVTPDSEGRFSVLLGTINPIPDTALAAAAAYLGVTISPDAEMTPRQQLVSMAYANRVGTLDGAAGGELVGGLTITDAGSKDAMSGEATLILEGLAGDSVQIGPPDAQAIRAVDAFGYEWMILSNEPVIGGSLRIRNPGGSVAYVSATSADFVDSSGDVVATIGEAGIQFFSNSGARNGPRAVDTTFSYDPTTNSLRIGLGNIATGQNSIAVGTDNTASGNSSIVVGSNNSSTPVNGVVLGNNNTVGSIGGAVLGGSNNLAAFYSTVAGGRFDTVSGSASVIGGGQYNKVNNNLGTISGGEHNHAWWKSTVGGGAYNDAFGDSTTVCGGTNNIAGANLIGGASIGGGSANRAPGRYATIPGGRNNSATGDDSFAAGRRAKSNHDGTFVWADGTDADFTSSGTDQFLIRAGGGVGIGTTSPQTPLHVRRNTGNNDDPTAVFQIHNCGAPCGQPTWTETTRLWNDNANGRSGIGFTVGTADLDSVPNVWIGTDDGGSADNFQIANNVAGSLTTRLYVQASTGEVGVGTTSPNYRLDVRGTIGNNATLYHSDRRWKENIQPLSRSLDRIRHLQGVSYEWRREEFTDMNFPTGRHIGVIAQDVEKIIPEVVQTDSDGYKSVEYAKLVAVLIEAVKEQQSTIEAQQASIDELRARIDMFGENR